MYMQCSLARCNAIYMKCSLGMLQGLLNVSAQSHDESVSLRRLLRGADSPTYLTDDCTTAPPFMWRGYE
eukprot:6197567-Pleurochrysis_carterae.AAC.1